MSNIRLIVNDLGCTRADRKVFHGLGFEVTAGEALMVRGANGSGKSTLLMCLAGLLPVSGNMSWNAGTSPIEREDSRQLIHFIGHLNAVKAELTLRENLLFWSAMYGGDAALIPQSLEQASLSGLDNYRAGHLSAGQRHRLSLARLLVSYRPVWLLDEPSSALDALGDQWVASLIDAHVEKGGLVITATHRQIPLARSTNLKTLELEQN